MDRISIWLRLLLDFVLNVAAKKDQSWREIKEVSGIRSGDPVKLSVYGATWPFELKVRSWVPVETEDGETLALPANEANLWNLLDSTWLQNNPHGIDLLHRIFGFRQLTLMTENLEPEVESNLVKLLQDPTLVQSAVTNLDVVKAAVENPEVVKLLSEAEPGEIQKIREELDKQKQQSQMGERNHSFGHAVQAAVEEVLKSNGLNPKLIDRGYDYEVSLSQQDDSLDEALFNFKFGNYFMEVKATTTKDVRLTPKQAETACIFPDRFVLCVVDLYGKEIKDVWQAADVLPHIKIITNIKDKLEKIYEGIDAFTNSDNPVHLHNEQLLRYGISKELWAKGTTIDEWIKSLQAKGSSCLLPHPFAEQSTPEDADRSR